jgi:hypothetical protein
MTNRMHGSEPARRLFQVTLSTDEGRVLSAALQLLRGMLNASPAALRTFGDALPPGDRALFNAGALELVAGGRDLADPQTRQYWRAVQDYLARLEQHLHDWLAEGDAREP